MNPRNRAILYAFTVVLYWGIHNSYILVHFGYLTKARELQFSTGGCLVLILSSYLVLSRKLPRGGFQIFFILIEPIFFAPLLTYLAFGLNFAFGFYLAMCIGLFCYKYDIGAVKIRTDISISNKLLDIFSLISLLISVVFVSKFEINIDLSWDLKEMYVVRESFSEKTPGFLRYLVFWAANFSLPYMFFRAYYHYKLPLFISSALLIVSTIFLFSIGNNKSFAFVALIALAYTVLERKKSRTINWNLIALIPSCYVSLLGGVFLLITKFPNLYLIASTLYLRIASLGPRQLDLYYRFMTEAEAKATYWSQSLPMRLFLNYPHQDVLGVEVSKQVLDIDSNANAAFIFSDGLAGFGIYAGPVVAFILFNFAMSLIFLNPRKNNKIRVLLAITFVLQVLNTSIFVSFLTGAGFFIMLLGLIQDDSIFQRRVAKL